MAMVQRLVSVQLIKMCQVLGRFVFKTYQTVLSDDLLNLKVCKTFISLQWSSVNNKYLIILVDGSQAGSGNLEILVNGGRVTSSVRALGAQRFVASFTPHEPGYIKYNTNLRLFVVVFVLFYSLFRSFKIPLTKPKFFYWFLFWIICID